MGGIIGDIMTGFFSDPWVVALDGVTNNSPGGWIAGNYKQMGYQLAAAMTCAAWSFVISCILLFVIGRIPGLHLRASEEDELTGLDRKYFSDCDMNDIMLGQHGSMSVSVGGDHTIKNAATPHQSDSAADVEKGTKVA